VRNEITIEEWRKKIETEMSGWKKLRYVYLSVCIPIVLFFIFNRIPGFVENHTVAIIAFAGGLGYMLRHWNGREEKRILLKIIKKIDELEGKEPLY
jgi:hypothetical protein